MRLYKFLFIFILLGCQSKVDKKLSENISSSVNYIKTEVPKVICTERDSIISDSEDPVIIKVCKYKIYQIKLIGTADYKGRYSYEYQIFKNGKVISNHEMFNEKQAKLIVKINSEIKREFKSLKNDPDIAECLGEVKKIRNVNFDRLQIDINEKEIIFNHSLELSDACFSVDEICIRMNLKDVEKYIAQ